MLVPWLVIFILVIVFFLGYAMLSKITSGIGQLYSATKELSNGNYSARVNIKTNDELGLLAQSFNKTAETLAKTDYERRQIDSAKTEFLSITSHELRSPMTPMKAQLQMLMDDYFGKLSRQQREAVDIVLRNTERLDKIIVDFLEISRIEAARLKFVFVKADLTRYIRRLREEMNGFLPEKKIEISLDIAKLPLVEVDPDRVMQVLRNLINNAKKFTKENGKIAIGAEKKGEFILFSVRDNGIGIPKDKQGRLFEPFYQVDNMYQHQSGGTGLGLAICKGIIESQGGRIWINSEEGKGTTFFFTIPLIPVKNMRPIKVLFSSSVKVEEEVKNLFIETFGPLGSTEFENLKGKGIILENLMEYVNEIHKYGIIQDSEELKKKIKYIFTGKKSESVHSGKGIDISDLKKEGLVK
jgi:signal transduction histidine kinase